MSIKRKSGWFLAAVAVLCVEYAAWAQSPAEGQKLYNAYCSGCHGEKGKGDGIAGRSLPVKPADHTDGNVMNQFSDKFLSDIITKGGAAIGKSSFMPAWGGQLGDKQVQDIIAYLRNIAQPPYQGGEKHRPK